MPHQAAAAAVVVFLAGCAGGPPEARVPTGDCHAATPPRMTSFGEGPDWSKEMLWVNVTAMGAFAVQVPVPTSKEGTQVVDWAANASLPAGWQAHAADGGVRVVGNGPGSAAFCSLQPSGQGEVAEAYLGAVWARGEARPESLPVTVESGRVDLSVQYKAWSSYCGAMGRFAGTGLGPGTHDLPGDSQGICT